MITTARRTVAIENRDQGMQQVLEHNPTWAEKARAAIIAIQPGTTATFEGFRTRVTPVVGEPGHPNAWGALSNWLLKRDYLQNTGLWANMVEPKSHGRRTPILRRTSKV